MGESRPRSPIASRSTVYNGKSEAGGALVLALGAAFLYFTRITTVRYRTETRQTAVRANLTPAVSRFGSGLYRYCISYNVRWAVRCMASACRAVSAVWRGTG